MTGRRTRLFGRVPAAKPSIHAVGWLPTLSAMEREALWQSAIEVLVAIHDVDWRSTHAFLVNGDPTRPDFNIDTLMLGNEIDGARFAARMKLQSALDRAEKSLAQSTEAAARREAAGY